MSDYDARVEYVGGPWDGLAYEPHRMIVDGWSNTRDPDGNRWGHIRYEPSPLTGDYLFVGRVCE